jgi:hypothetical protein
MAAHWRARHLLESLTALDAILPEEGFGAMRIEVASVVEGRRYRSSLGARPPHQPR